MSLFLKNPTTCLFYDMDDPGQFPSPDERSVYSLKIHIKKLTKSSEKAGDLGLFGVFAFYAPMLTTYEDTARLDRGLKRPEREEGTALTLGPSALNTADLRSSG